MSISNSSAARRAGFKVNNKSIDDAAAISMAKVGCRTLRVPLPAALWVMSGTSVAIAADGIFPTITLPDANQGDLYTSCRLPAEWEAATNITLNVYWKTTLADITKNVKFTVELASKTVNESTALSDTQLITDAAAATANQVIKSSTPIFAAALFAAGDVLGIHINRNPADAADTLATDIEFISAELEFTGRG